MPAIDVILRKPRKTGEEEAEEKRRAALKRFREVESGLQPSVLGTTELARPEPKEPTFGERFTEELRAAIARVQATAQLEKPKAPPEPRGGWFAGPPTEEGPPVSPEERITELGPPGIAEYREPERGWLGWMEAERELVRPVAEKLTAGLPETFPDIRIPGIPSRPATRPRRPGESGWARLEEEVAAATTLPTAELPLSVVPLRPVVTEALTMALLPSNVIFFPAPFLKGARLALRGAESAAARLSPQVARWSLARKGIQQIAGGTLSAEEQGTLAWLRVLKADETINEAGKKVLRQLEAKYQAGARGYIRGVEQAMTKAEPRVAPEYVGGLDVVGKELDEAIQAGVVRARTDVPIRPRAKVTKPTTELPTVAAFEEQVTGARGVVTRAQERLSDLRKRWRLETSERAKLELLQKRNMPLPPEAADLLKRNAVTRAEKVLAEARRARDAAVRARREALLKAGEEDVTARAIAAGADEGLSRQIGQMWRDAAGLNPMDDGLLQASLGRRVLAQAQATVEGTVPGLVGRIAGEANLVRMGVEAWVKENVAPAARQLERLVKEEFPTLQFTGRAKWQKWVDQYPYDMVVRHPELWKGMSPALVRAMEEVQRVQRTLMRQAEAWGYPVKAIDEPYIMQFWEMPKSELQTFLSRQAGKVRPTRQRTFGNFIQGLSAGAVPKEMSIVDLVDSASRLMAKAIADAFERKMLLLRYGTKMRRSALAGYSRFRTPLYSGYYAPADVVSYVEQLHQMPGRGIVTGALTQVGAEAKQTVFGIGDLAIFGVHLSQAVAHGGPQVLTGLVNRFLALAHLPHAHLYLADDVSRAVRRGQDGVKAGWGPSGLRRGQSTLLKYAPGAGKYLDAGAKKWIDFLGWLQYDIILNQVRNLAYEGSLLMAHLGGRDITRPLVRRTYGDWANAISGAGRGAAVPGRRQLEETLLISAQIPRSEMAILGQVVKAATKGATVDERIIAMMTLTSVGAIVYGLGSIINTAVGNGPVPFDPRKPDWATVQVGGMVIPLIPRRGIVRAIAKSFDELRKYVDRQPGEAGPDFANLFRIWLQYAGAKAAPLPRGVEAAAGFGFEPGAGYYQVGTLSPRGRFINMMPLPPILSQYITEPEMRGSIPMTLQGLGFGIFPEDWRREAERVGEGLGLPPIDDWTSYHWDILFAEKPELLERSRQRRQEAASAGRAWAELSIEEENVWTYYDNAIWESAVSAESDNQFRFDLSDLMAARGAALHTLQGQERFADIMAQRREREAERLEGTPEQALLQTYREIVSGFEPTSTQEEKQLVYDELDKFWAGLNEDDTELVLRNLGLRLPPRAKMLMEARRELKPYWDARERLWPQLIGDKALLAQSGLPSSVSAYSSYGEWRVAMLPQYIADYQRVAKKTDQPLSYAEARVLATAKLDRESKGYQFLWGLRRARLLVANPVWADLLSRWYGQEISKEILGGIREGR